MNLIKLGSKSNLATVTSVIVRFEQVNFLSIAEQLPTSNGRVLAVSVPELWRGFC